MGAAEGWIKRLYARSVLSSLSNGASQPFIAVYAAVLGATSSQIGFLHAVNNLAASAFQPLWGFLSDKSGARVKPILYSTLVSSLLWVPILLVGDPAVYIAIVGAQFIVASVSAPIFTALIGEVVPLATRSMIVAALNFWSQAGSLISTLSVGFVSLLGFHGYQVGFSIAAVAGVLASLVFWGMKDSPRSKTMSGELTLQYVLQHIISSRQFLRFTIISNIYGFYMSVAWPCFTVTMTRVVNLSFFEIAVLAVISGVAGLFFSSVGRGIFESWGDVRSLAICRASLVSLALVYAYIPSFWSFALVDIVAGMANAGINISLLLYITRITSVEDRGTFTAVYNLLQGLAFFFGSLVGGQLLQQLEGPLGLEGALRVTLTVSAVGRLVFGLLHYQLQK
ncbi:MAG: MFS transporter [Nitrososphaerota archaeon]|nr:MFS transporter [Candidatus Calditenuaceae archaeon]MDW8074087.1 MFS transporter [Nitrososphaerota archaeon]